MTHNHPPPTLKVSQDHRRLEHPDGRPFVWVADTAWELIHRLNLEQAERYFTVRSAQGFTVIQTVVLAELDGLRAPNAYGRVPLEPQGDHFDPTRPDLAGPYSYWDHLEALLELAAAHGFWVALLPTWGDKFSRERGAGPEIFTPENAHRYACWLAQRLAHFPQLIWVLGGDRRLLTPQHRSVVSAMAAGLREVGSQHLITFHPIGERSPFDDVGDAPWLDFRMVQSGHGAQLSSTEWVAREYVRQPTLPILDGEPRYEDHPVAFDPARGYFDAWDVRTAQLGNLLSGALGLSYGHHSVWGFQPDQARWPDHDAYFLMGWEAALERPGAQQVRVQKQVLEAVLQHSCVPAQHLLAHTYPGLNQLTAAAGPGLTLVYSPTGLPLELRVSSTADLSEFAQWSSPRTGERTPARGTLEGQIWTFRPPSSGRGEDWLLWLEN